MVAKLSLIVLILAGHVYPAKGHELNSTPFRPAEVLLKQGLELVDHDRFDEAIAIFRKAIAIAPGYLRAHVEYIRTQSYFLEAYNDVRIEYEALMANEPDNPIYPIALVLGAAKATLNPIKRGRSEKVVALAPDWMRGPYSKLHCLATIWKLGQLNWHKLKH